jgi:hypothetical protein
MQTLMLFRICFGLVLPKEAKPDSDPPLNSAVISSVRPLTKYPIFHTTGFSYLELIALFSQQAGLPSCSGSKAGFDLSTL